MTLVATASTAIYSSLNHLTNSTMGNKAIDILNLDVKKLIEMLNAALSEEWLAFYQYWIGARLMEGPMRSEIEPELLLHATQELNHATLVVERIIQLRGTPVLDPKEWFNLARCGYEAPVDPYVEAVLEQNLKGERCAMVTTILNEELEHENDIEDWLIDINRMKEEMKKIRL